MYEELLSDRELECLEFFELRKEAANGPAAPPQGLLLFSVLNLEMLQGHRQKLRLMDAC